MDIINGIHQFGINKIIDAKVTYSGRNYGRGNLDDAISIAARDPNAIITYYSKADSQTNTIYKTLTIRYGVFSGGVLDTAIGMCLERRPMQIHDVEKISLAVEHNGTTSSIELNNPVVTILFNSSIDIAAVKNSKFLYVEISSTKNINEEKEDDKMEYLNLDLDEVTSEHLVNCRKLKIEVTRLKSNDYDREFILNDVPYICSFINAATKDDFLKSMSVNKTAGYMYLSYCSHPVRSNNTSNSKAASSFMGLMRESCINDCSFKMNCKLYLYDEEGREFGCIKFKRAKFVVSKNAVNNFQIRIYGKQKGDVL